jgi:hypothetical protein
MAEKTLTTLRVSPELLARADSLVELLKSKPDSTAFDITRSSMLRLALQAGLEELERRYTKAAPAVASPATPPPPERREKPTRRAGGPRPDAIPRRKDERKAAGFPAATGGE